MFNNTLNVANSTSEPIGTRDPDIDNVNTVSLGPAPDHKQSSIVINSCNVNR